MTSIHANEISQKKMSRRALIGSTSGAIIEWYDFSLYATASAVIFPKSLYVYYLKLSTLTNFYF